MDFSGIWPGVVVSNSDPLQKGRIQVRTSQFGAPTASDRIADTELPWALPCVPFVGKQSGAIMIPEVGAGVWVMFFQHDPHVPVWLGSWISETDAVPEFQYANGPKTYLIKTPLSNQLILSDMPADSHISVRDFSLQEIRFLPLVNTLNISGGLLNVNARAITMTALTTFMLTAAAACTMTALAGFSVMVTGLLLLSATSLQIAAATVSLGIVLNAQSLCNKNFADLFNLHTHQYSPGPGSPVPTSMPGVPAVEGIHTTINVRAS